MELTAKKSPNTTRHKNKWGQGGDDQQMVKGWELVLGKDQQKLGGTSGIK